MPLFRSTCYKKAFPRWPVDRNHPCSVGLGPWGVRGKGVGRQSAVFGAVLVAGPCWVSEQKEEQVQETRQKKGHMALAENNRRRCSVRQNLTQLSARLGQGVRAAAGIVARLSYFQRLAQEHTFQTLSSLSFLSQPLPYLLIPFIFIF